MSASLVLCDENPPVTGGFPNKGPVMQNLFSWDFIVMQCGNAPHVVNSLRPEQSCWHFASTILQIIPTTSGAGSDEKVFNMTTYWFQWRYIPVAPFTKRDWLRLRLGWIRTSMVSWEWLQLIYVLTSSALQLRCLEVRAWMSNYNLPCYIDVIIYPCPKQTQRWFDNLLTHCGLVTPYGGINMCQHWLR